MWIYKEKPITDEDIPEKSIGFIYLITNILNNKKYIGRKLLTAAATKTVNGKKKKIRKESNWRDYWSSSPFLMEEIESVGKQNFVREILFFVPTLGTLSYLEEKALHMAGALESNDYYNGNIRSRVQKNWVYGKITDEMNITLRNLLPPISQ